jgi:hypothetical protein
VNPAITAILMAMLWAGPSNGPLQHVLSMDEAARSAVAAKSGNIVGSYVVEGHSRMKYVFEIAAPEGTWKVKVDAATGKVIRTCLLDSMGANGCRSKRTNRRPVVPLLPSTKSSLINSNEDQP